VGAASAFFVGGVGGLVDNVGEGHFAVHPGEGVEGEDAVVVGFGRCGLLYGSYSASQRIHLIAFSYTLRSSRVPMLSHRATTRHAR
jgi:hypothetical protein